MVCGGDRGSCPRRPRRSRDRLVAAPPLSIISSTLTHAHLRAKRGNWHRWRELNLPWVVFIDDRPTPILYTCIGQNESRCGSGRWAARSVDVRVNGTIGVGSIGMHAGGRGGGAPAGGAPGAEPSARAGLWKRGSSPRGADDQPRFTGGLVRLISLICRRTRASDRLSARLLCGTGEGRQATHRIVLDGPSSSSD